MTNPEIQRLIHESGRHQVKMFYRPPGSEEYIPCGSGSFLKYQGRSYLVTCRHCILDYVSHYEDIIVPIAEAPVGSTVLNLTNIYVHEDDDLATFELRNDALDIPNCSKEFFDITQDISFDAQDVVYGYVIIELYDRDFPGR